jgi:4-diphosphocytidyl-2-C-methyl-D-erythritol kinase
MGAEAFRVSSIAEFAPAKINLTLRIAGRRTDGYHELESLVVFADVGDQLTLSPEPNASLEVSGPFGTACGPTEANLILKAVAKLGTAVPDMQSGLFALDKRLPVAAGIGGGSSDAAAALRVLAKLNRIAYADPRLASAALAVGADVPVCLDPRPRIMRGIGEILSKPFELPRLPALLVNPRAPTATKDVFAAFDASHSTSPPLENPPRENLMDYLQRHGNDLTAAAIACVPIIGDVLDTLRALAGAQLARMSGSGSTCFALFGTQDSARIAARQLAHARPDWWVAPTTLG